MLRRRRTAALAVSKPAGFEAPLHASIRVEWVDRNGNRGSGTEEECAVAMKEDLAQLREASRLKAELEAAALAKDERLYDLGAPPLEASHHYVTVLGYEDGKWVAYVRIDDGKRSGAWLGSATHQWARAESQSTASIVFAAWEAWEYAYPKKSLPKDTSELIYGP